MDNSPSASNSSSSTPPDTPVEAAAPVNDNRAKRFDFLLKQTEVFSHFMGGTNKAKSPLKVKPEKKQKKGKIGDSRHRMTEQEEDEELLDEFSKSKKNVVTFDESPSYIKVCT